MRIQFLLNGEAVRLERVPATRTLLDWLREERGLTGTKEGCNEGDCGACSVIVTDASGARALNACLLFLPQIDGRAVRTVEGIAGPHGEPHPVQAAMVEHHGSQCGFCTPGFVVAMAAAHLNGRRDHDDELAGCLCRCTGYAPILRAAKAVEGAPVPGWMREDLSRLAEAACSDPASSAAAGAARMTDGETVGAPDGGTDGGEAPGAGLATGGAEGARAGAPDGGAGGEGRPGAPSPGGSDPPEGDGALSEGTPAAEGAIEPGGAVVSSTTQAGPSRASGGRPTPPSYASVASDWGRRDPLAGTGASDAGGSGSGSEGRHDWVRPRSSDALATWYAAHPDATLVAGATDVGLWVTKGLRDLGAVAFLSGCEDLRRIEIGPTEIRIGAMATVEAVREALAPLHPAIGEVLRRYGSAQVRHAATLGGNIANGSPIGDGPPLLIALGATLHLRRGEARRSLPLEAFFLGYGRQDRGPGEFVEAIAIPREGQRLHAHKLSKRFDQDISAVCGAFVIAREGGVVREARVAYGGMAAIPKRAGACEAALLGRPWSEATLRDAMEALGQDFAPLSDLRASAAYRLEAARAMLRRVWLEERGTATRVLEVEA